MSTAVGSRSDDTARSKQHRGFDDQDIDQIYGPTRTPTGPSRTA